jgi:hypothetical protein
MLHTSNEPESPQPSSDSSTVDSPAAHPSQPTSRTHLLSRHFSAQTSTSTPADADQRPPPIYTAQFLSCDQRRTAAAEGAAPSCCSIRRRLFPPKLQRRRCWCMTRDAPACVRACQGCEENLLNVKGARAKRVKCRIKRAKCRPRRMKLQNHTNVRNANTQHITTHSFSAAALELLHVAALVAGGGG